MAIVKIKRDMPQIVAKIEAGAQATKIAVTEQILVFSEPNVPVAEGTLRDSALIKSRPKDGVAVWDTPYAKKQYYTHKTKRMWAQKAVDEHKTELQTVAQNAFTKGIGGK